MTPDFNNIDRDVEPAMAPCRCGAADSAYCWDVAHRKMHEWREADAAWWILSALNGSGHANAMSRTQRQREANRRLRWERAARPDYNWRKDDPAMAGLFDAPVASASQAA